ncbi:MAG TPA: hypothetical protein VL021_05530 [Brumimicrobium sp.]|nr:hypothetical protein [Brumimicrobium sp.]
MKNSIYTILFLFVGVANLVAQNPQGVTQVDKEHKNLWESPESMMIALLVVVGIIVARYISKRAFIRRNKEMEKDNEELDNKK